MVAQQKPSKREGKKTKKLNKTKTGFFFNPKTEGQFHSIYELDVSPLFVMSKYLRVNHHFLTICMVNTFASCAWCR